MERFTFNKAFTRFNLRVDGFRNSKQAPFAGKHPTRLCYQVVLHNVKGNEFKRYCGKLSEAAINNFYKLIRNPGCMGFAVAEFDRKSAIQIATYGGRWRHATVPALQNSPHLYNQYYFFNRTNRLQATSKLTLKNISGVKTLVVPEVLNSTQKLRMPQVNEFKQFLRNNGYATERA